MRCLMLILMIALLPVRGWASDVMSVAHASQQLNTIELVATQAMQTRATATFNGYFEAKPASSMPWDCPMAAQGGGSAAPNPNSNPFKPLCHGCGTCQLCMALVTGYPMALVSATCLPQAVEQLATISFSSAERAPGFKPPIS